MGAWINVFECVHHQARWINHIADPCRIGRINVGRRAVFDAYRPVNVTKQIKREIELVAKCPILGGCVGTYPNYDCVACGEFWDSITEPLALNRSTRCIGLRVPPQHGKVATQAHQRYPRTILVGKLEFRRRYAGT